MPTRLVGQSPYAILPSCELKSEFSVMLSQMAIKLLGRSRLAYEDLRGFITALERAGELKRIGLEVDPILEISEIADRVSKRAGPALLFENVRGSRMPLIINAFGSARRMAMALGVESVE